MTWWIIKFRCGEHWGELAGICVFSCTINNYQLTCDSCSPPVTSKTCEGNGAEGNKEDNQKNVFYFHKKWEYGEHTRKAEQNIMNTKKRRCQWSPSITSTDRYWLNIYFKNWGIRDIKGYMMPPRGCNSMGTGTGWAAHHYLNIMCTHDIWGGPVMTALHISRYKL